MEPRKEVKPLANPTVTLQSPATLFSDSGKTFTLRRELPPEAQPPQRDWPTIARDFLSKPGDIQPLGANEPFNMLDTTRSSEFVAGQGAQNWSELKKEAVAAAKDRNKRARR